MSDTKLDPASLTAEERAIVEDAVSHHAFFDADGNIVECDEWTWCYRSAIARILARRALFAPAKEEAKVLPCGCVRCTCENETQCQGCGAKNCAEHRASRTAPPSEMPPQDEVKAVAHNVRECGSDEAAALILALSLVKWRSQPAPAPPAEMPEAVYISINTLRADHHPTLAGALESWWRSHQAQINNEREHLQHEVDEAIRLLSEITEYQPLSDSDDGYIAVWCKAEAFLAVHFKEDKPR